MKSDNNLALWGAIVVSVVGLIGFITVSVLVFTGAVSADMKTQLLPVVVTGWLSFASGVFGFWLGSSMGSMHKNELMRGEIKDDRP
jgi:hypothetical protein